MIEFRKILHWCNFRRSIYTYTYMLILIKTLFHARQWNYVALASHLNLILLLIWPIRTKHFVKLHFFLFKCISLSLFCGIIQLHKVLLTWTNPFYFFNGWDLNDRMKCVLYWNGLSPIHFSLKRGTIDFLYLTKTFKIQNSHSFLTRSLIYGHFFLCMHRMVYITPHPPYF